MATLFKRLTFVYAKRFLVTDLRIQELPCSYARLAVACRLSSTTSAQEKLANDDAQATSQSDLQMSDGCIKHLKKIADTSQLRVVVEGGGCSGFQYKFNLDSTVNEDDRVFEKDGAKIVVDKDSLEFIKGATIDYHEELIRCAFRVLNNPKAETGCSCGASFSVKLD